jgi:hypothetical protein
MRIWLAMFSQGPARQVGYSVEHKNIALIRNSTFKKKFNGLLKSLLLEKKGSLNSDPEFWSKMAIVGHILLLLIGDRLLSIYASLKCTFNYSHNGLLTCII